MFILNTGEKMTLEEKAKKWREAKKFYTMKEVDILYGLSVEEKKVKDLEERLSHEYAETQKVYDEIEKMEDFIVKTYGRVGLANLRAHMRLMAEKDKHIDEKCDDLDDARMANYVMRKKLKELGVDPDSLEVSDVE
jgi:hypothetical protein